MQTVSATTKFTQGSTSNQQLTVKNFQAKTVKHVNMKNDQNRICLTEDDFTQNKLQ